MDQTSFDFDGKAIERQKRREYSKKYGERYPARKRAHALVYSALKYGELIKPDHCSQCMAIVPIEYLEAHHKDYRKPLDVEWLCMLCHAQHHAKLRANRR